MKPQLTLNLFNKYYADIIELRNNFLLPVNADEYTPEDESLHLGLYRSEMVELSLAETNIKRLDALVDGCYVLFGALVHQGNRTIALAIKDSPIEYAKIEDLLFINEQTFTIEQFDQAWDIIHQSNLSKICTTEEDKKQTLDKYKALKVPCKAYKTPKGWVVKATKDCQVGTDFIPAGKFLKSVSYKAADLTPVFS